MNHPKVYDAKGRVLEVGSRVEERPWHHVLEITHLAPPQEGLRRIDLRLPDGSTEQVYAEETMRGDFKCPRLLLITDDEKGKKQ